MRDKEDKVEKYEPRAVQKLYDQARAYKSNIGRRGLYEQARRNERFMLGDQWNGLDADDLPKPVLNVIKQIGDYKVSNIISNPCTAVYEFDGVPTHLEALQHPDSESLYEVMSAVSSGAGMPSDEHYDVSFEDEHNAVATALTAHFNTVWQRTRMDDKGYIGIRKAYMHGACVLYSYFDPQLPTGLYADTTRRQAVKGDIETELLDITNVYFGDPSEYDIQRQPWIIISQRCFVYDVKDEMRSNKIPESDIEALKPDRDDDTQTGNYSNADDTDNKKVTVLTMFRRDEAHGNVHAVKVAGGYTVRPEWDTKLTMYPFAVYQWDVADNCVYGHSEITELIPNQIAINRMLALEILSEMMMGMPKIIYNEDAITEEVTNDPGQIIGVQSSQDVQGALRYVNPAQISPNWNNVLAALIDNTKIIAGATNAALGDIRPENTSAIIATREAAALPLQPLLNRYYSFIKDIARIWGEIILRKYGKRLIKVEKNGEVVYVPFNADKYKDMMLTARIEVGASSIWSTSTTMSTLNNLLQLGGIDIVQFLERVPEGMISKRQELINDIKEKQAIAQQQAEAQMAQQAAQQPQAAPEQGEQSVDLNNILSTLSEEQLAAVQENPDLLNGIGV